MLTVGRSPKASRFTCFHSVSMAFNAGVARGSKRISIPRQAAQNKLLGAVCCPARSSKSTMFQPRRCRPLLEALEYRLSRQTKVL